MSCRGGSRRRSSGWALRRVRHAYGRHARVVRGGLVQACVAKAGVGGAGGVVLVRALNTAGPVAGFDEKTLGSGPAGEKKYVHGAFTEEYSAFWLGARSLDSMQDAGILPDFAGIVVSDRYQN